MTFDDACAQFAAHLLTARGRSRATVDNYARDLEQFAQLAGVGTLAQFDRDSVLRWLSALAAAELAPRSRARKLSALRSFIRWAQEYRYIDSDPLPREVNTPKELYLPHALSEAQVKAMLDAVQAELEVNLGTRRSSPENGNEDPQVLRGSPASQHVSGEARLVPTRRAELRHAALVRDYAILEVLYASGMRVSELCGLRLLDLHLGEGFAIVTGKGSKQRLVPLGQYALDALRRYLAGPRVTLCKNAAQHGEVFLSQRGPISRSQVFRLIKDWARAAGIKAKVSPHTFRHSCASHLLAHGADLRLVQELLGHSALSTTQVYTHIEKSRLRKVYDECHPMA